MAMSDMNQLIRDRRTKGLGAATVEDEEPIGEPAPQPTFGTYGSAPILNRPRRSMNDRMRNAFDNRPRAGTYRIGA